MKLVLLILLGEPNDAKNKGVGLKHILEKHGSEFNSKGFKIEFVIPFVLLYGKLNLKKSIRNKIVFKDDEFRIVIKTVYNNKKRIFH